MKEKILSLAVVMNYDPFLRWGQCVFNAAYTILPQRADELRGSDVDCFYRDDLVDAFLDELVPDTIIFKFNSGMGAILCPNCRTIIKTMCEFTPEEMLAHDGVLDLPPYLCDKCKK